VTQVQAHALCSGDNVRATSAVVYIENTCAPSNAATDKEHEIRCKQGLKLTGVSDKAIASPQHFVKFSNTCKIISKVDGRQQPLC